MAKLTHLSKHSASSSNLAPRTADLHQPSADSGICLDLAMGLSSATTSSVAAGEGETRYGCRGQGAGGAADTHRQARRGRGGLRRGQDRVRHPARRPRHRRVRRAGSQAPDRAGGQGARAPLWAPGRRSRGAAAAPGHRGHPGRRRADAHQCQPLRHGPLLHRLPRAAREAAHRPPHAGGRRRLHQRVPGPLRLARVGQRQPGLFARRADPEHLGQDDRQLLAEPRLPAAGGGGAPQRRPAHPRPRHARRLLRRLVAAHAAERGPERRARQGRGRPAEAHVERRRADRELSRHAAERMGRCPGLLQLRHLHGALCAHRRARLSAGQAVHPGADLQPECAEPVGLPVRRCRDRVPDRARLEALRPDRPRRAHRDLRLAREPLGIPGAPGGYRLRLRRRHVRAAQSHPRAMGDAAAQDRAQGVQFRQPLGAGRHRGCRQAQVPGDRAERLGDGLRNRGGRQAGDAARVGGGRGQHRPARR
jgi:hypothetical protein